VSPLNLTVLFAGVALKFVPEMVTVDPAVPLLDVTLLMVGKPDTLNGTRDVPVPATVVMETLPFVAR